MTETIQACKEYLSLNLHAVRTLTLISWSPTAESGQKWAKSASPPHDSVPPARRDQRRGGRALSLDRGRAEDLGASDQACQRSQEVPIRLLQV